VRSTSTWDCGESVSVGLRDVHTCTVQLGNHVFVVLKVVVGCAQGTGLTEDFKRPFTSKNP
jgi:hypothetical protein